MINITPLNTGVALVILILFCVLFDDGNYTKLLSKYCQIVGGCSIILLLADLIWAAFYYITA